MGTMLPHLNIKFNRKVNSVILEWMVILLCFGYPLQAMIVAFLKTESTPVNIGFRSIYFLAALYMIYVGVTNRPARLPKAFFVFALFWIIYGIRIIYDTEVMGVRYANTDRFYVYAFAFGNTLIPTLAVFLNTALVNIQRFTRNLFWILLVNNICIVLSLLVFSQNGISGIFAARSSLIIQINGTGVDILNSITLSSFGGLLCLASITMFLMNDPSRSWRNLLLIFPAIILGFVVMLAGASRGPMISFLILLCYLITYTILRNISDQISSWNRPKIFSLTFWRKLSVRKIFKLLLVTLLIILIVKGVVSFVQNNMQMAMFSRIKNMIENTTSGEHEARYYIWLSAWEQFKEHPVIGDRFLTSLFDNAYAHNLILDSLMATGIIGSAFFLFYMAIPFFLFFRLTRVQKSLFMVLWIVFLNIFLISMVSGGLFVATDFWVVSALLIGLFSLAGKQRIVTEPVEIR